MVDKHAYLDILLLLHSAFMLCVVKIQLKGEVGGSGCSHGNYIDRHGKSWKNHGIVILNFCGNPDLLSHAVTRYCMIYLGNSSKIGICFLEKSYI